MTVQKFIKFTPLTINGEVSTSICGLNLDVLETSGNYVLHKNVVRLLNAQRQWTVSTKNKSEVRGGGRKPWRQKGTGRSRAGSNRSPLWKGGGVIFGPKSRSVILKTTKKERKLALQTLLYNKKNKILIIEDLESRFTDYKTKNFLKICQNCQVNSNQKLLVVVSQKTVPLKLSTKNLHNVELISAKSLNILSLLKANQIILTSLALNNIKETYCE